MQIHSVNALPRWKRLADIAGCLIALPLLAIVALGAALFTSMVAPGPIFFRQERVGYMGRRFLLYKFRTMQVNANTALHQSHSSYFINSSSPMQKLDVRDNRLIPGAWLWRASGLDELPQIINVLRGEMSIVGPRPCIPYEYEAYTTEQRDRLQSVPGLTGLWQVSGKNRTTFAEMVRLDIAYSRQRSPALDFRIVLRTIPALFAQLSDMRKARRGAIRPVSFGVGAPLENAGSH